MERVETNFVHETILSAINHKPQRLLAVILNAEHNVSQVL